PPPHEPELLAPSCPVALVGFHTLGLGGNVGRVAILHEHDPARATVECLYDGGEVDPGEGQPPSRIGGTVIAEDGPADQGAVQGPHRAIDLPGLDPALAAAAEATWIPWIEAILAVAERTYHRSPSSRPVTAPH